MRETVTMEPVTLESVLAKENLNAAWSQVKANDGAAGVDGWDVESSYLDSLDKKLEQRGLSFVRYADDIAIFISSPRSAERVKESVIAWIEKHLKVEVNRDKSGSGPSDRSGLLGFRLYAAGRIGVTPKTVERLKAKVRELWDGRQSLTSGQLRDQWQRYIRGWWNYCQLADWRQDVENLAGWTRRHMRKCFWLR